MSSDNHLLLARSTTRESVVDHLRTLILDHHFKPGERLVQSDLAQRLGVSRTPLREALHQLAAEGLVTISAYKGAYVADFSLEELGRIYCVRIALEGYAARLAAEAIDEASLQELEALLGRMKSVLQEGNRQELLLLNRQFHTLIYASANQPRMFELITIHIDLAEVYRRIFVSLDHARNELVNHEEVLLALRSGDGEAAERLTRLHLQKTARTLTNFFESQQQSTPAGAEADRGWVTQISG